MSMLLFARFCNLFMYGFCICCGIGWESEACRGEGHAGVCRGVDFHSVACCVVVLQRIVWCCPRERVWGATAACNLLLIFIRLGGEGEGGYVEWSFGRVWSLKEVVQGVLSRGWCCVLVVGLACECV